MGCYLPLADADDAGSSGVSLPVDDRVTVADGVPCAVQQIVSQRCQTCHGARPSAPMSLMSRADLKSNASLMLARLRDAARPMPPSGLLAGGELATVEAWLNAGLPVGTSCDAAVPSSSDSDAGVPGEGLPCEVEALLAQNCRSCHGATPSGPMSLITRDHLLAPSVSEPTTTVGALSVRRMSDAARPMPPGAPLSATQIKTISNWVNAGMPAGSCAPTDAGRDIFDVPAQCTSKMTWSGNNTGSPQMNPGRACLTCHAKQNAIEGEEKAPAGVGGTVYPSAHEPDLCNGLPGGAEVILTGADGKELRMTVNAAGNFFSRSTPLARPYRARVVFQGRERRMGTPQTSSDCNSCHTQAGANGAPGRIVAP